MGDWKAVPPAVLPAVEMTEACSMALRQVMKRRAKGVAVPLDTRPMKLGSIR